LLLIRFAIITALFLSHTCFGETGVELYRSGDYGKALPLLRTAFQQNPKDDRVAAALLSSLVEDCDYSAARDLAESLSALFPNSAAVLAARGEFVLYAGNMMEAEKLFKASLKVDPRNARACLGLSRLLRAASIYRGARLLILKAREFDDADVAIATAFTSILPRERQIAARQDYLAQHAGDDDEKTRYLRSTSEFEKQLKGAPADELAGAPAAAMVPLVSILHDAQHLLGFGLKFTLNGSRPLTLLLDTGASGITIQRKAAERAGIERIGSFSVTGIGDKGARESSAGIAETCTFAPLTFKNCSITVLDTKGGVESDGLVGTDYFARFLMELNFEKREMRLTPHSDRPENPQGYDRVLAPGFTPVFRFGHHLMIATRVNDSDPALFLVDTGSTTSLIDTAFAAEIAKVSRSGEIEIRGLSGRVNDVSEANRAVLQFAGFRQTNVGLTAIDLNTGRHAPVRMAGILGLPVLNLFSLTLDYRNGQVKFDYQRKR
jgi:predicted aspartyl protease